MMLRGPKLLARKYEKPERIGSIIVNPAWRTDNSRSLWEVVQSSPEADDALRMPLEADWILVTAPNSGVFFDHDDAGREIFLLAASSVLRIIPWTTETEAVIVKGTRILAKRHEAPAVESAGGLIVTPEAFAKRPRTATIMGVGDEVNDPELTVGANVLFTVHAGIDVELNGEKLIMLDQKNVLAVVEEGEVVT